MEDKKQGKLILIIFIATIIVAILLMPLTGSLYEKIIRRPISSWLGTRAANDEGLIISYLFLISLALTIFIKRLKLLFWFTIPVILLILFVSEYELLLIGLVVVVFGYLLGQLIFFLKSKFKKPTPSQQ